MNERGSSMAHQASFGDHAIVACGTLIPELQFLKGSNFLDTRKILFTKPGRHESPPELESQLIRQIRHEKTYAEKVIVVYGGKFCYINTDDPYRTIDTIIDEQGAGISRIKAEYCVDMLTSEEDRDTISGGKGTNIYWLTPGWLPYRQYAFQDRDKGFAIENFPKHKYTEGAGLLDGIGFYDKYCEEHAEELLEFSDWMELPILPYEISLDRLKRLLLEAASGK
jgi:hypothetical protein